MTFGSVDEKPMVPAVPLKGKCPAVVSEPPWYLHRHRCNHKTSKTIAGLEVCGTHFRLAKKWEAQGRLISTMENWWYLTYMGDHWSLGRRKP